MVTGLQTGALPAGEGPLATAPFRTNPGVSCYIPRDIALGGEDVQKDDTAGSPCIRRAADR
jgi:hypothetical protein